MVTRGTGECHLPDSPQFLVAHSKGGRGAVRRVWAVVSVWLAIPNAKECLTLPHRPDYSEYVAHFTRAVAIQNDPALNEAVGSMTPLERLANILEEKVIRATKKYFSLGLPSVAFTECPWTSLLDHAGEYSSYGIGFTKRLLWDAGGQPAVYLRSSFLNALKEHTEAHAQYAPVVPGISPLFGALYTPIEWDPNWQMLNGQEVHTHIDYSQEREWRVVSDFSFAYQDIHFIVVDKWADVSSLPPNAVSEIGEDRILSMANYRRIMELWPP